MFLEARYGSEGARGLLCSPQWFEILLRVLTAILIVVQIATLPYRCTPIGFVTARIAFIIVLIGATTTRFVGGDARSQRLLQQLPDVEPRPCPAFIGTGEGIVPGTTLQGRSRFGA